MAVGFPAKTDFADGGYLTGAQINDITGTLNLRRYAATLLSTTAITASASMSITSIVGTYTDLLIIVENAATVSTGVTIRCTLNTDTSAHYGWSLIDSSSANVQGAPSDTAMTLAVAMTTTASTNNINGEITIRRYASTVGYKLAKFAFGGIHSSSSSIKSSEGSGIFNQTPAITSIQLAPSFGNWVAQGTIYVYGIA